MSHRRLLATILATGLAGPACAGTLQFHAALEPSAEVPPTKSSGSGEADATLDTTTHRLGYDITFKGFSSAVTMAHFHGPADAGTNAPVQVPLGNAPASPVHGSVILSAEQQQQLMAGTWYVNVHTANNPKGAIRGQMMPKKS